MKNIIIKIFLFALIFILSINAQPYIYFPKTFEGENYLFEKVQRYNLRTNTLEDFPPQFNIATDTWAVWDPSQSYLAINYDNNGYLIYDCNDTSKYFDLPPNIDESEICELLYSPEHNKLYIFSENYGSDFPNCLSVLGLSTGQIISTLSVTTYVGYNILMHPRRNSFFSPDGDKIYFFSKDTLTKKEEIWTYSLETNEITSKKDLSELGYPNMDGYDLTFGRNGKGIIGSYSSYNNPVRDFYYRIYDFVLNSGSELMYHNGLSEAYFNGDGELLIIMNTSKDDLLKYYHSGSVRIHNTQSGQLIRTFNVPEGGTIYTFDEFPNDIYYALNLDTQPEIYNLTQLRLNSISPAMSFPFISNVTVAATGEFFTSASQIYFNGQLRETTYISDSTLSFQLNLGDISTVGEYSIWVNNYGSNSDTLMFSVVENLPQTIMPILECVRNNGGNSYTAFFGYNNNNSVPVFIPIGTKNKFFLAPEDRGQPTIFLTGRQTNVFSVDFTGKNLIWELNGRRATANKNSTPCP